MKSNIKELLQYLVRLEWESEGKLTPKPTKAHLEKVLEGLKKNNQSKLLK